MVLTSGENTEMALEDILLRTGEMEHMERLLRHCARDKLGLGPQEMLKTVIHPLLDELELHIISEVSATEDAVQLKAVVHRWIASRLND
ncbi:hypothetical protein [Methanogenium cariaci]|jgi:hypothetical protein